MAKPPAPIQPLQGLAEMQFLLEVIRDKDLLQQVMDDIEARRKTANEIIELIGPASEIEAMNARARTHEAAAEKALSDARSAAERLVAAAKEEADSIVAAATDLENGVKQAQADAEASKAAADRIVEQARAELAGIAERERGVAARVTEAERMIAAAEKAKADFEARTARLAEAMKSAAA